MITNQDNFIKKMAQCLEKGQAFFKTLMLKRSASLKAFTLIEMMTSIFIIVMITAVFTANYRANNKRTDLVMTAQKMVADIRAAQNNSLGLVKYGEYFPSGGWAMNFDLSPENKTRYVMFADLNAPVSDEPGRVAPEESGFGLFNSGEGDVALGAKIIDLPRGVIINSLETENNSAASLVNINFLPPDPVTRIFNGATNNTWVKIILKDTQSGETKTVFVNFLGLIEVID